MDFMDTTKKIIKILSEKEYSVQEARAVLDFAKKRIDHNSKIIYKEK